MGGAITAAADAMSPEELELAVIGTIGSMDSPTSPADKGFGSLLSWLSGESAEARQAWRDQVIGTTLADLRAFGQRLDARLGSGSPAAKAVVIGSTAAFEAAEFAHVLFGARADAATMEEEPAISAC